MYTSATHYVSSHVNNQGAYSWTFMHNCGLYNSICNSYVTYIGSSRISVTINNVPLYRFSASSYRLYGF